jgi:hypothetical protein
VKDRIQSWASIVLGAAVVVLVGWLTMDQMSRTHIHEGRMDGGAGASASSSAGASATSASGASTVDAAAASEAALTGNAVTTGSLETASDAGLSMTGLTTLLDAGALPTGAPRTVRLGVVLVPWAGAEGAPSSARAKPDALKHALELAEQAKGDWKAAVKAGDSGSSEDIGRIPRGVLDRTTEVAVFSLEKDGISEPLETPRGYWVVKRIE